MCFSPHGSLNDLTWLRKAYSLVHWLSSSLTTFWMSLPLSWWLPEHYALQLETFPFPFIFPVILHFPLCVCMLSHFCHVWLFATPGTPWSPRGSSVHGIIQGRILERVAMPSSKGFFQPRNRTCISCDSCIASKLFTIEPPRKPHYSLWYICIFCYCCCCHLM